MLDKARQGGAVLAASAPPLFVVALLTVSLFLLVCDYLVDARAFNSDNLLSVAQCDDLLHGRDVTDWHLPGAPYLFPDLLLLMPCQLLAPTLPLAFLAYCLVLHLTLAACLTWLGRLTGLRWRTAILAAGCGSIFLIAMNLNKTMSNRACLLVHPGSHAAALVVGLFMLALTVYSLRRGRSWPLAALYVLIAGFGGFSDQLVVAQFLAPLALALILLAVRKIISAQQAGIYLSLLATSFLLSYIIKRLFAQLGFHLLMLETSSGRLHLPDLFSMLRHLYQGIAEDRLLCVLIPLHLLAALLVVWLWSRRAAPPNDSESHRPAVLLAAMTFVLSPLCILGALFVLGMSHQGAIGRYTLSCWYLPPLLLPLLMCWLPGRTARTATAALQAGILLFALQRAWLLLPSIDGACFEQPYPPLAQALDRLARQRGSLNGLSGFWSARSTAWFTREKVAVNVLSPMGEPWFHASNPARFLADDNDLRLPKYQFLLVQRGGAFEPSAGVLTLQFGTPAERIAVGSGEIWLYDALRTPAFDRFLRTRLADRLHQQRPYTGPIDPACLARPKRSMTPLHARGTIALEPGQTCEMRFASPIAGQVLDVGAGSESRLEVEFFHGDERLGSLSVPSVPWTGASYEKPGIQSRLLPLPAILRERTWDRLIVRPHSGSENVILGHVLVFAESIAGLEEERPPPRLPRLRLEAEELLPINPGTPYTDDADVSASGGRVRRAAVDFPCCFVYTPRLFLPPGRYRLQTALKVDSNAGSEEVVSFVVGGMSPPTHLAERALHGRDFPAAGSWITQQIAFEIPEDLENVQFGIVASGKTPITVDYLDLIAESEDSTAAR